MLFEKWEAMRLMRSWTKYIISPLFLLLCLPLQAQQQITGVVVDAETGEVIPMASLIYKGHNVATDRVCPPTDLPRPAYQRKVGHTLYVQNDILRKYETRRTTDL